MLETNQATWTGQNAAPGDCRVGGDQKAPAEHVHRTLALIGRRDDADADGDAHEERGQQCVGHKRPLLHELDRAAQNVHHSTVGTT